MWSSNERNTSSLKQFRKVRQICASCKIRSSILAEIISSEIVEKCWKSVPNSIPFEGDWEYLGDALQSKSNWVGWNAVLKQNSHQFWKQEVKNRNSNPFENPEDLSEKNHEYHQNKFHSSAYGTYASVFQCTKKMFTVIAFYWCEKFIELKSVFKNPNTSHI